MSFQGDDQRKVRRAPLRTIALVTVYRDDEALSYKHAIAQVQQDALLVTSNVFGQVEDVSGVGLGLKFPGQALSAQSLLVVGNHYLLRVTLRTGVDVPTDVSALVFRQDSNNCIYLRMACRWFQPNQAGHSRVGFELTDNNPAALRAFGQRNFAL